MIRTKSTLISSLFFLVTVVIFGIGCTAGQGDGEHTAVQPTLVETITVKGFEPDGEPVIKRWSDGSVSVQFEAMPPFFAEDNGSEAKFADFEKQLEQALGVKVVREDRELFRIDKPRPDSATQLKAWLEGFHAK